MNKRYQSKYSENCASKHREKSSLMILFSMTNGHTTVGYHTIPGSFAILLLLELVWTYFTSCHRYLFGEAHSDMYNYCATHRHWIKDF